MAQLFLKKTWLPVVAQAIVIAIGILAIIVVAPKAYSTVIQPSDHSVDSATYQAVFLTNNQIYFGHLTRTNDQFLKLQDVFYVQLPERDTTRGRVVRLGDSETHRPTNEMIINSDHILFWENLQTDSPIIQTIRNLQ